MKDFFLSKASGLEHDPRKCLKCAQRFAWYMNRVEELEEKEKGKKNKGEK